MPEANQIKSMFSKIAANYDSANNILSVGIHHLWRKKLVQLSQVQTGQNVLDCATGTGDLAIEFKKAVGPTGKVIGTDFCADMLNSAPEKAKALNMDIDFQIADVMKLSYPTHSFDCCSISFGIRNVEDPLLALKEMARVTKPGGQVMVLEFGEMVTPVIGPLYNFYSEKILPKIGGLITGQKEAYEYLQKSSAKFPSRENFLKLMDQTDAFSQTRFIPVSLGIAYIYIGKVK